MLLRARLCWLLRLRGLSCQREGVAPVGVRKLLLKLLGNLALEAIEGRAEVGEDVGSAEAVARRVVGEVDWVHDYKHLLVHLRKGVKRPKHTVTIKFFIPILLSVAGVHAEVPWVETVRVEVEEAHEQARGGQVGALLQLEVVHVSHHE